MSLSILICKGMVQPALAGCDRPECRGTYQLSAVPGGTLVLVLFFPFPWKGGPNSLAASGRVSWSPLLGGPLLPSPWPSPWSISALTVTDL